MTPHPVWRSPGSSPRTRISLPPSLASFPHQRNRELTSPLQTLAPRFRGGDELDTPRSGAQPLQHILAGLKIRVDVLDIVAVFERLEQLEQPLRRLLVDRRRRLRAPAESRRQRRPELLFERVAHRVEIIRRRDHDMAVRVALDLPGAGLR